MNRLTVIKKQSEHQLPENWWEQLQRYGLFLSKDRWDGEDLAQEAVIKALLKYPKSEWSMALLKKVTYHAWVDKVRKQQKEELLESVEERETTEERKLDEGIVEHLLTQLTAKQAIIFFLKEAFQYKAHELADCLGMSEEAVKGALLRARRRLQTDEIRSIQPVKKEIYDTLHSLFLEALKANDPTHLLQVILTLEEFPSTKKSFSKNQSFSPMCIAA
ncbi:sigma factor-like helix-turn-helix DNA-binding protein [Halobacillus sp. BBL2006]|uniref:sigma factor-like helix-turn-helix DNA-binding protein n=1 Tax=Halobacillus sp. BBL2006 TaxID=1543706 RepID=UPI000691921F|nr:sigma factor-like helix-turn-helix DNA-binding protein [Halobacillus sp. BBL2006]